MGLNSGEKRVEIPPIAGKNIDSGEFEAKTPPAIPCLARDYGTAKWLSGHGWLGLWNAISGEAREVHSDFAGQWDGRISGPPETVYFARKVNPWH